MAGAAALLALRRERLLSRLREWTTLDDDFTLWEVNRILYD